MITSNPSVSNTSPYALVISTLTTAGAELAWANHITRSATQSISTR